MSFFAGRLNNVPTFSLKNEGWGDINRHITPDDNTLFHSSMPHVLITEEYEAQLQQRDYGYWTCAMPGRISSLLANDANLVVLTEVEYYVGNTICRRMLYGGATGVGAANWQSQWVSIQIIGSRPITIPHFFGAFGTTFVASNDVIADHGFFSESNPGGNVSQKLLYGTGRKLMWSGSSTWESSQGASNTYFEGGQTVPNSPNYYFDVGHLIPPSGAQRGFDSFYIKAGHPRIEMFYRNAATGSTSNPQPPQLPAGTVGYQLHTFSNRYNGGGGVALDAGQAAALAPNDFSYTNSSVRRDGEAREINYGFGFAKVRWYVTNLRYNGWGYDVTYQPFAGNSILLSPKNFVIKDVNLMNTAFKFINLVSPGNGWNRPDMHLTSPNIYRGNVQSGLEAGDIPWNGVETGGMGAGTWYGAGSNWGSTTLALYKFQPSASWYVNSTVPSIGNQWGDVWSPGQIPLRLFGNRAAVVEVSGGAFQLSANQVTGIQNANLGLNDSRNGAVVMTIVFNDITWFLASGRGVYNPMRWNGGGSLPASQMRVTGYGNSTYHIRHQILSLPVGGYVPFYVCRCGSMASYGSDGSSLADHSTGFYTVIFYIRNIGNGEVEFSCELAGNPIVSIPGGSQNDSSKVLGDYNAIRLPSMRITVQRLV